MIRIAALVALSTMALFPALPAAAQQPQQQDQQSPAAGGTSQPASPAASASPGILVGSDSLVGSTVRDGQGRDIGKVSRLMIDPAAGRIANLVVETGGRLGVGGNTVSLPWNSVKVGQDGGKVIVTASQMLESAPSRPATSEPKSR